MAAQAKQSRVTRAGPRRQARALRWDLRVAEDEDALVKLASSSAEVNFTTFVRNAALAEARRVLADRTSFALDEADWRRFMDSLDRPARVPEGLRELYSKPSAFE
jgi:uncharacterized protein (DUF1778 family)